MKLAGPLDDASAFPGVLNARVVSPGEQPRVHGYDVEGDLARHYQPSDTLFLALTGELPTPAVARGFATALVFFGAVSVAHASTHAATVARLCGSPTASIFGVAAIGAAEQARALLDEHEELVTWLRSQKGPLPERYRARTQADRESVARLEVALAPTGLSVPGLAVGPSRDAALVMLLFACGLKRRERMEAALVLARLPTTLAEALAERPTNFANYPINLPRYVYSDTP